MSFDAALDEQYKDTFKKDVLSNLLVGVHWGLIGTFVPFVARSELGASPALIGLISAASFIGSALTLFLAHRMEGRPRMPFYAWPLGIGRVLFGAVFFVGSAVSYSIVITLAFILAGVISPAYTSIMMDVYPDDRRATIMSRTRVGFMFMIIVFTLLGGWLLPRIGYRLVFVISSVIGVVGTCVFASIRVPPAKPDWYTSAQTNTWRFIRHTMGILRADLDNRRFAIGVSISGLGMLMAAPIYTIFQVDKLNMSAGQLAVLGTASSVTWMITYPFWGRYSDSRDPIRAWIAAALLTALLPLNYFLATTWWHVIPGALLSGAANGGFELGFINAILKYSPPGREAQHQALHSFIMGGRGIVGPFLGAVLVDVCIASHIPIKYLFLLCAFMAVYGAVILLSHTRSRGTEFT